jgi:hypothetical protein
VNETAPRRRLDVEEDAEYAVEDAERALQAFLMARITRPSEVSPHRIFRKMVREQAERDDDDD